MQWMRTDIAFPDRRAILSLYRRDILMHHDLFESMGRRQSDNDINVMHDELMKVIVNQRPELTGATIHFINYRIEHDQWWILVSHPSFDPVSVGCMPNVIPLIKPTAQGGDIQPAPTIVE